MRSTLVLLAVLLLLWFGATAVIQSYKLSPPAQFERLHRVY